MGFTTVILAAGKSTRMKSKLSKVLHPVAGKPILGHVIDAARGAGCSRVVLVVGHQSDAVRTAFGSSVEYVEQAEQLGTGHALLQAKYLLEDTGESLMVLAGDAPLLKADTLHQLHTCHVSLGASVTLVTGILQVPTGFGRIVRGARGTISRIVEEKDASEEERRISEVNSGVYCFNSLWLWSHLQKVKTGKSGEIYLTDVIEMATTEGSTVESVSVTDGREILGINDRVQLAEAEEILRHRIRERWMLEGVTISHPSSVLIDADVKIGRDTIILPNSYVQGTSDIGEDCIIGPNSLIRDSRIGKDCRVMASVIEESVLEDDIDVGPFSHIRGGSSIGSRVHIGNFAEIKKSRLGPDTKMGHFSYMGDATVGTDVNIAAGTVTCNFDGIDKHETIVGDNVFIGSDTMLIAPVELGDGAKTGAGSVVTRDVPPNTVVYGVPAAPRPNDKSVKDRD